MISDDERGQYAARQYQSLRDEMAQARQSQQAILQWSQAVSATLFAAALVAGTGHSSHYVIAAQFVLGVILPAVLLGGALTWSGEMICLTRIGIFLRSFEKAAWSEVVSDPAVARTSLFIWQNFAWSPPRQFTLAGFSRKAECWLRWNWNIFRDHVYWIGDSFRRYLFVAPRFDGHNIASRPWRSRNAANGATL